MSTLTWYTRREINVSNDNATDVMDWIFAIIGRQVRHVPNSLYFFYIRRELTESKLIHVRYTG